MGRQASRSGEAESRWLRRACRVSKRRGTRRPHAMGSSAPPRREAVGHAGVSGAVRQAWMGVVAAEGKVLVARIVERPAALALRELEQRAALRAFDWRQRDGRRVADA